MKTILFWFVSAALVAASATAQPRSERAAERELVVEFAPDVVRLPDVRATAAPSALTVRTPAVLTVLPAHRADALARAFPEFNPSDTLTVSRAGRPLRLPDVSRVFVVRFPSHADVRAAAEALSRLPSVVFAEPNGGTASQVSPRTGGVFRGLGVARRAGPLAALAFNPVHPNDEYYDDPSQPGVGGFQWGLHNTGQDGGTVDADIDAPEAWTSSVGEIDSKIGIIDGGTRSTHEDLTGKVTGDGTVVGDHGTHVAGIAAARGNNTYGIAGVSWNSPIYAKYYGNSDPELYNAIVDAVYSVTWTLNHSYILCAAGTCNNAVPGPRYSTLVRRALAAAYRENISNVVAVGNYNTSNPYYPAAFGQGVIAVGASDRNDLQWDDGPTDASNTGPHLDVVAPGKEILSSVPQQTIYGPYAFKTGTSMAAPHVAGMIGLLLGRRTDLYHDDHENLIRLSAEKVRPEIYSYNAQGYNPKMGYGRVNARRLLDRLEAPYVLNHIQTSGGYVHSTTSNRYTMAIYDAPNLASGSYSVNRTEVRKAVTFPQAMQQAHVWGLGHPTVGWADNGAENFTMGWAEPVPGTVSTTGAVLRTFVYEVFTTGGTLIGWYPSAPANVQMWYTLHGVPAQALSVSISGPSALGFKQAGLWTASAASGGGGTLAYAWYTRAAGDPTWLYTGVTSSTYTATMETNDFELRVDATKGTQSASATKYVTYGSGCGGCLRAGPDALALVPDAYGLDAPRPNPFGAQTELRFALPEAARVRLAVYDVLGREVAVLADGDAPAGTHAARFEAGSLPAGVYVYRFVARGGTGAFVRSGTVTLVR